MSKISTLQVEKVDIYIVNWLKTYAENAKVNGFVVGISGGVDSAVTSTLCAQTGMTVLCVEMPIHQAASHVSRGREHIEQLKKRFPNVSSVEADLTSVFENFKTIVPIISDLDKVNVALANTRARLRMTTLYYFAGIHGLLVAGTGNKVEDFGVGFYTKYGDGGVDLSPIANLMKSDVYALGKYLQIPHSILEASPTDGLFGDDRTDEDQLGASYDELEWAMVEKEEGKVSENFSGREKISPIADQFLLSQMIYFGKQLYLKDLLLPEYSDADKIGYTQDQNKWCEENEGYMWRYFLENEMLYSDDSKLSNRFINPAPFSKFYLEIDNESPGRVGTWIGWQMVRSYMNNNDVPLEKMLKMNAKELFEKSKYKPKKNGE